MGSKKRTFVFAKRLRLGFFPAALAVLFLALPAGLFGERHGATLRLDLLDGRRLQGELLAVKGETLILLTQSSSEARAVIGDVAAMRIVRENRVGKGLVSGLVIGFVAGCLYGLPYTLSDGNEYSVLPMVMVGGMLGGAGAVIGAGAGLISGSDETIRCRDRDAAWRSVVLKRLQRLARFRDYQGKVAGSVPGKEREPAAAIVPFAPQKEEFARWQMGATIVQSPRTYEQRVLDFSRSFRYRDPISAAGGGSSRAYDEAGIRSWVRVGDIRLDYFLTRRWAIGILLDPFARKKFVYGDKALRFAGQELTTYWNMSIASKAYFLTASYSLLAADGFLRKTALRLRAGLGWNRSSFNYGESAYAWNSYDDFDPDIKNYNARADMRPKSSLSALVEGEAAQYVNSRWSLALNAGFRYVPLRIREHEMIGTIIRRSPLSDLGCSVTIPDSTLNIGGFYLGATLGIHF